MIKGGVFDDRLVVDKTLYRKYGLIKAMIIQFLANSKQHSYTGTIKGLAKQLQVFTYIEVWRSVDDLRKANIIKMKGGEGYNNRFVFNGLEPRKLQPPKSVAKLVESIARIKKEKEKFA